MSLHSVDRLPNAGSHAEANLRMAFRRSPRQALWKTGASRGVTVSFLLVVQAYLVFPASVVMSKVSGEATLLSKSQQPPGFQVMDSAARTVGTRFIVDVHSELKAFGV